MNAAQTALYFREWGRVRDVLRAKGLDPKQVDARRHELHAKALGADKSSKDFTNGDLDKVLAAFKAITEPGNLRAQIRALEQPQLRRTEVWVKIMDICAELKIGDRSAWDESDLINRRHRYVYGIIAKVFPGKTLFEHLDDKQANVLLGIMQRRQMYQRRAKEKLAAAQEQVDQDVPF